ncbi:Bug family tripartite tricarboxylate transporter substrate binding protein [Bordetella bronchiseptica]|uniref:Exported protein n=1 Tax=Bordetella bronchiseptica (strain ATCC BAA-588 / NCTC 13252 / RB50) TaxID=257310 RepID=A0A0H3LJV8_BORBR|nr:tripartite tricarboxylate transporter substrate binding protein [Bordetella bronchiseptica]KAK68476.1 tripartite tricarboxylate transporter family receptor [Bordetella bronchiseptica 980-2]KDD55445.1 tripartite tricarboxylate transporter family receptor [Bordetella bronchiseptica OSU553]AMG87909.1 tripartite tricarboxylate transporter substrate binding protein [Bordetella bronchiseptica]KCV52661.1 tripartite tricarboxylate transporter family receptor [Bordetella bronchiseptica 3E44]KCV58969
MIKPLGLFAGAIALLLGASAAHAEPWPQSRQPIRLVIPFAPGGTTDILGRMMAEGLSRELKVSVIAENIAGANGNLGAQTVARAKPDGNTLMLGTPGPMIVNKYVYKNLAFDPKTAFAPVALVAELPNVLMVRPDLGVADVAGLVGLARKEKDGLTFGSPSVGSSGHVSTELFKLQAGVSAVHVPYKGSSPMLVDLMSGNTDFTIDQISSAIGFIQGGKIKALAVTSRTRSAQLPDVPTLREAGFPDYEVSVWFCVAAPAGTPEDRIQALNAALNKVLAEPAVRERLASLGAQPLGGPAQDLARQILTEEKNIQAVTKVVSFDN